MALNILEGFDFSGRNTDTYHKQLEAMKLAFVDGQRYVTDPRFMKVTAKELLSKDYAGKRRSLIGREALRPLPGEPASGGTIYLCTADGEGNMVSFIPVSYTHLDVYKRQAKAYYQGLNRQIEIIKLNGSIELAPILGLSDVIVDIVETGTTLRENNLHVYEKVAESSARLIANKSSFKFKQEEIQSMVRRLAAALDEEGKK